MKSKNLFIAAALASIGMGAMNRAQPYTPKSDGCESRKPANKVAKEKAKKKMAAASHRRNRK